MKQGLDQSPENIHFSCQRGRNVKAVSWRGREKEKDKQKQFVWWYRLSILVIEQLKGQEGFRALRLGLSSSNWVERYLLSLVSEYSAWSWWCRVGGWVEREPDKSAVGVGIEGGILWASSCLGLRVWRHLEKGPSQVRQGWIPLSHHLSSSFYTCDCLHAVAYLALGL